jgi:hypothetical protein
MIIGVSGAAGAGKDCSADYIIEHYGFQKISFADPLKAACAAIFHLSHEQLYGDLKETIDSYWGVTPRFILQKVGTECMRNIYDKDIWVKSMGALISRDRSINYIVPDVRFFNEVCAIRAWEGKLLRVERPGAEAKGGIQCHASETELASYSGWDYTIFNDSTREDFYRKVDNFMKLVKP